MNFLNQIFEGWESFFTAIRYRFDSYEWWEWDRDFWEEINIGWYREYIFKYDDFYVPSISKERQLRLAQKPTTIYTFQDESSDSVSMMRVEKILNRQLPLNVN